MIMAQYERSRNIFYPENILGFIFIDLVSLCINYAKMVFKAEIQSNETPKLLQRTYQHS